MTLRTFLLLFFTSIFLAGPVNADSETRLATPAEKAFYAKVIAACTRSVASVGLWQKIDESGHETAEYENVSPGTENMPLVYHYYAEWADQERLDKASNEISSALAEKLPEVPEASESQDVRELEELSEQVAAAAAAGNMAEVERLNSMAEEISARSEAIFAESDRQFREVIEKLAARDARAVVRIGINQFYQGFDGEPVAGKLSDGTEVFRVENGRMYNETWVEGTTYVILGKDWKAQHDEAGASMEKPEAPEIAHDRVQSVVIAVEAEQKRALQILEAMNLESIKSLLD